MEPRFSWMALPTCKQETVREIVQDAKLEYDNRTVSLPKGMVASDPKIADRQTRLDILEEEAYKAGRQLLEDVYRYNTSLRPEDFAGRPTEEGKTQSKYKSKGISMNVGSP